MDEKPRPVSDAGLKRMHRRDKLQREFPFVGCSKARWSLQGFKVGRLYGAARMKRRGIEGLCRKRNTSKPGLGHKIDPCLRRKMPIAWPNEVSAMDIACIPMARGGFIDLAALLDGFTQRVLAWRVSITLEADF